MIVTPIQSRLASCCLIAALCLAALSGCASYRYGQSSLYASDVRTVYVPMIEAESFRRNLGERMTEALCKDIETNTPYKVVNDPNADSTMYVRLVNDTKRTLVVKLPGDVRDTEVNFQIQVNWVSRTGTVLSQQTIPLPQELVDVGQTADLIPEYGRSMATTQQEIINRLANRITGMMEAAW